MMGNERTKNEMFWQAVIYKETENISLLILFLFIFKGSSFGK